MVKKIIDRLRVRAEFALLRRRQVTSERLRTIFRERYDIEVGAYSYGCFDPWRMSGPLRIGRWCSIASTARSVPVNHPLDALTTHPALYERAFGVVDADLPRGDPQVIEDDVWIGHYALLLPGCRRVGRGAVIGAGAVVTRDVAPYTVVAGNPAKVLRQRFDDDLIAALETSRWWELDAAGLRALVEADRDLAFHPTASGVTRWAARDAPEPSPLNEPSALPSDLPTELPTLPRSS